MRITKLDAMAEIFDKKGGNLHTNTRHVFNFTHICVHFGFDSNKFPQTMNLPDWVILIILMMDVLLRNMFIKWQTYIWKKAVFITLYFNIKKTGLNTTWMGELCWRKDLCHNKLFQMKWRLTSLIQGAFVASIAVERSFDPWSCAVQMRHLLAPHFSNL